MDKAGRHKCRGEGWRCFFFPSWIRVFDSFDELADHPLFDFTAPSQLGIRAFHLDRNAATDGDFVVRDLKEFMARILSDPHRSHPREVG